MLRLLLIIYMCVVSLHLVMWNSHQMQDCINKVTFDSWGNYYIATYMIHLHRRLCCSNIQTESIHRHTNTTSNPRLWRLEVSSHSQRIQFQILLITFDHYIVRLHFISRHSDFDQPPYFELRPLRSENQLPSQVPECRVLKSKGELYLCWGFAVG